MTVYTAYPIEAAGAAGWYAVARCGNDGDDETPEEDHQHTAACRNCPWHVDADHYSQNTIDSAYTATGGS